MAERIVYPARASVAVGRLNGWECQRVSSADGTRYLIERSDGKLHDAPAVIHAKIDAAIDGVQGTSNELLEGRNSQLVLKAKGASSDATDRENCANASPDGGPMGAGQAAAAAPAGVAPTGGTSNG